MTPDEQSRSSVAPTEPGPKGPRLGSARDQRARRLAKIEALRARGINPYPYRFDRRVFLIRRHGGLLFLDLRDAGGRIQPCGARDAMSAEACADLGNLDSGDWVVVEGTVMVTRTGEESIRVERAELLSKAIRPLPSKGRGVTDPETRLR